ncbi:acyl-homoserine-lactone synthase [Sphingomonas sp. GlSt437]|uniref:acyl-homoserine-lactone synthase n=1 Tax=Sphingomonas sp. GlSt437 TaxID=3389970 RepID=UPI003A8C5129
MIHVITASNSQEYCHELSQFFKLRREIFVEEKGWNLASIDGEERDEYDDDQAIYLLNIGQDGKVVAGQRVRPTTTNSMLSDHFPAAVAIKDRPIADETTWEVTRGFVIPELRRSAHRQSRAAFRVGSLEVALEFGIDRMLGITEIETLPWFFNMGYHVHLIGLPVATGETSSVALEIAVNHQAIAQMREIWALDAPSSYAFSPSTKTPVDLDTLVAHLGRMAGATGPATLRHNH